MTRAFDMPRFQACSQVQALKIYAVGDDADGNPFIEPEDGRFGRIYVTHGYMAKHNPQPGGWYLVHSDGFASFAPDRVFRSNFRAIE